MADPWGSALAIAAMKPKDNESEPDHFLVANEADQSVGCSAWEMTVVNWLVGSYVGSLRH